MHERYAVEVRLHCRTVITKTFDEPIISRKQRLAATPLLTRSRRKSWKRKSHGSHDADGTVGTLSAEVHWSDQQ